MKMIITAIMIVIVVLFAVPPLYAREDSARNEENYYIQEIQKHISSLKYYTEKLKGQGVNSELRKLPEKLEKELKKVELVTEEKGYKPKTCLDYANSAVNTLGSFDDQSTEDDEGSGIKSKIQDIVKKEIKEIWDRTPTNKWGSKSSSSWDTYTWNKHARLTGLLYHLEKINEMFEKIQKLRDEEVKEPPKTAPAPGTTDTEKNVSLISPQGQWYEPIAMVVLDPIPVDDLDKGMDTLIETGIVWQDSQGDKYISPDFMQDVTEIIDNPDISLPDYSPNERTEVIENVTVIRDAAANLQEFGIPVNAALGAIDQRATTGVDVLDIPIEIDRGAPAIQEGGTFYSPEGLIIYDESIGDTDLQKGW